MRRTRKITKGRKIIQIAGVEATVMALCDDGSVWLLAFENGERREWKRMADISEQDRKAATARKTS